MTDEDLVYDGLPGHRYSWFEDDVAEYCECGKWLEQDYYTFIDHLRDVLKHPDYWRKPN